MASDSYDKTYNESIWEIEFIGTRDDGNYTESREWEKSSPKQKNYTQENYCVLRFADVLLMLAEAENEYQTFTEQILGISSKVLADPTS